MFHTPLEQHFSDFCLMRAVPCDRFLCLHVILPSPQTQTIIFARLTSRQRWGCYLALSYPGHLSFEAHYLTHSAS